MLTTMVSTQSLSSVPLTALPSISEGPFGRTHQPPVVLRELAPRKVMSLNSMLAPQAGSASSPPSTTRLPHIDQQLNSPHHPHHHHHHPAPAPQPPPSRPPHYNDNMPQEMSLREAFMAAQAAGQALPHAHLPDPTQDRYAASPTSGISPYARFDPAIEGSGYGPAITDPNSEDVLGLDGKKGNKRELSSSKRAAQNRAAQRAFRQRKEEYIKQLEERAKDRDLLESNCDVTSSENYHLRDYILVLQDKLVELAGEYPSPPAGITIRDPASGMPLHHQQERQQPAHGAVDAPQPPPQQPQPQQPYYHDKLPVTHQPLPGQPEGSSIGQRMPSPSSTLASAADQRRAAGPSSSSQSSYTPPTQPSPYPSETPSEAGSKRPAEESPPGPGHAQQKVAYENSRSRPEAVLADRSADRAK